MTREEDIMHSGVLRRLAADHIQELVTRAADARRAGEARRARRRPPPPSTGWTLPGTEGRH
jgi:hypothetical protein